MSDSPLITVVIATYNRADLLAYTLRSVQYQDEPNFEVWVVGDGCTDGTEAVVAGLQDERFHWYNLPQNHLAPHAALNEGLRRARGTYIAYLDHDDLWFPGHLSGLLDTIRQTGADLVYGMSAMLPNAHSDTAEMRETTRVYGEQLRLDPPSYALPSAWLHHRRLYEEGIRWLSPFAVYQNADQNFLKRVVRAGYTVAFSRQLTTLIFNSIVWKMFDRTEFPQQAYWERLQQNPDALYASLLLDVAQTNSRTYFAREALPTLRRAVKDVAKSIVFGVAYWYGRERFPVSVAGRIRFLHRRKGYNRKRGLTALLAKKAG